MTTTSYPRDDLDQVAALRAHLGSYWDQHCEKPDTLAALLQARLLLSRRLRQRALVTRSCLARPVLPAVEIVDLEILDLALTAEVDPSAHPSGRSPGSRLRHPAGGLTGAALLQDAPVEPAQVLVDGIDFAFDSEGRLTIVPDLHQGGDLRLWALRARLDDELYWNHAGFLAGLRLDPLKAYKALTDAILDAGVQGPAWTHLEDALEALTGAPRALYDGEVVEDTADDGLYQLVLTDRSVYHCPRQSTLLVSTGDELRGGQWLCDTVRLYVPPVDLSSEPWSSVTGVSIDGGMLDPTLGGPLTFENDQETITVSTVSSFTKITWPMPDDAGEVAAFFTLMHSRGVAAGATLANYLDTRPQPQSTQPSAANLPTTVNPLDLLVNRALRNHFYLVLVREDALGDDALGLDHWPQLRKLLPPETGVLLVTS